MLFFDEVDALAANRHDLRQSAGRTVINQFLEELDGAICAPTRACSSSPPPTRPGTSTPAFRRPGRFDRIALVTPPDEPARASHPRHYAERQAPGHQT
ncbi:MAG: ATP-binding protein [Hymenobacter sp.]